MSEVERRYSQIEKECLAIVYGCEKFHIYLYGRSFEIDSDAKALEYIFNNTNRKIPMRIERWTWRLLTYDFKIRHVPGIRNPVDYLSRHPVEDHNSHVLISAIISLRSQIRIIETSMRNSRELVRSSADPDLFNFSLVFSGEYSPLLIVT